MNKSKIKLTAFILLVLFSNTVLAEAYFDISENKKAHSTIVRYSPHAASKFEADNGQLLYEQHNVF